ncbi:MAG: DUF393 domain-containing protein [Euryarchaeota archaeon]|nr:DUF393 domain-containing protein [Euryarchaeota archaeon]
MVADGRDTQVAVLYDQDCGVCTRTARAISRLDARRKRLRLVPFDAAQREGLARSLAPEEFLRSFHAVSGDRVVSGAEAIPVVLERLPFGSVPARLIRRSGALQRMVARGYGWVSKNRWRFGTCKCDRGGA